jgi:hypothetical protein
MLIVNKVLRQPSAGSIAVPATEWSWSAVALTPLWNAVARTPSHSISKVGSSLKAVSQPPHSKTQAPNGEFFPIHGITSFVESEGIELERSIPHNDANLPCA